MRTIAEIKKTMTDAVLADATLVQALNLDTTKSWDAQVSAASILNLIIFIVAVGHYTMEWMFEQFTLPCVSSSAPRARRTARPSPRPPATNA